jgi:hypothetical protein
MAFNEKQHLNLFIMIWKKNVDTIFGEGASAFFFGKIYDI